MYERVESRGPRPIAPTRRIAGRGGRPGLRLLAKLLVLTALIGAVMMQAVLGTSGWAGPSVVVRPGQTLWSIASQHYPQSDPRAAISAFEAANSLHGAVITPGERLVLPPA